MKPLAILPPKEVIFRSSKRISTGNNTLNTPLQSKLKHETPALNSSTKLQHETQCIGEMRYWKSNDLKSLKHVLLQDHERMSKGKHQTKTKLTGTTNCNILPMRFDEKCLEVSVCGLPLNSY